MARATQSDHKRMTPEKRKEYLEKKKRVEHNRKILGVCLCAVVIIAVLLIMTLTVLFKVDTVTVNGKSKYDEAQIITASGISKGTNLIMCDTQEAAKSISANLPYISDVSITKDFPSGIIIEVTPAQAYMALETSSGTALADKNGKILEFVSREKAGGKVASVKAKIPFSAVIGGNIFEPSEETAVTDEQKSQADTLKALLEAVESCKFKDITAIDIKSTSDILIMYQNRLRLNIGSLSEIEYKLKSAVEIIRKEDEIDPSEKGDIYLSNTKNFYVSPESINKN